MVYEYIQYPMTMFMFIGPAIMIASLVIWMTKKPKGKLGTLGIFLIALLGLVLAIHNFYTYYDLKQNVLNEYEEGNYIVVEGDVIPLDLDYIPNGSDEFSVNGILFEVGDNNKPGLQTKYYYGGPITGESQTVKIYYVSYKGENFIMKLEILSSD